MKRFLILVMNVFFSVGTLKAAETFPVCIRTGAVPCPIRTVLFEDTLKFVAILSVLKMTTMRLEFSSGLPSTLVTANAAGTETSLTVTSPSFSFLVFGLIAAASVLGVTTFTSSSLRAL